MHASQGRWRMARHHAYLNRKLVDLAGGRCPRLIVEMPPQHGKSQMISQYGTAWYLGTFPDKRVILSSYEAGFAAYWGRKSRDLLEAYGPSLFGVKVSQKSSAADHWEIDGRQGMMNTAGVGGPVTGKSADLFIVDDPVKNPEEARSKIMRDKVWEWFEDVAMTRLQPGASVIVIMTRWHKDDLAGRLERQGGWEVIKFPAVALPGDQLGRAPGEGLWPEHYGSDFYARVRAESSAYKWAALYQQDPTEEGGNIVKNDWLQWFKHLQHPVMDVMVQSWDTAFKEGTQNDYSVCGTWGATCNGCYLIDLWRGRVSFPDLERKAIELYNRWHPEAVLVEDKASGQSLLQTLQRDTMIPLLAISVDRDKVSRLNAVSPMFESKRVFIPEDAPFTPEYVGELCSFPNAPNDDQVDMTSQALAYLRQRGNQSERVPVGQASVRSRPPSFGSRSWR